MSFAKDYADGWGQLLAESNLAIEFAFPAGNGTGSAVPIYVMTVPDKPSRVLTLSPVPLRADPTLAKSLYQLQIRSRSEGEDVSNAWAIDDAVQDLMLGLYPFDLPTGVHVETSEFAGGASLGQDKAGRWMWSSNWTQTVYRPGPNRL